MSQSASGKLRSGFPVKTHGKNENLKPAFDSTKSGQALANRAHEIHHETEAALTL
jgi:hypothetical protein